MNIINWSVAREYLGEHLEDIIKQFLEELPEKQKLVEEAETKKQMAHALHKLNGTLNIIGVERQYIDEFLLYEGYCLDDDERCDVGNIKMFATSFCRLLREELEYGI